MREQEVAPFGEMSVAEVVALIAKGDTSAEHEFVRRYQRGVTALVRRHCRPNEPDVPDLVQDVLTAVLARLRAGALRDGDALAGYLQTSVVRITTAEYRKRAQRHSLQTQIEPAEPPNDSITQLDRVRQDRLVRQLLAQLPNPRDREVLRRFYINEDDKEEVCAALGIDADHFRRVLFRARQRMKELLLGAGIHGSGSSETVARLETPA